MTLEQALQEIAKGKWRRRGRWSSWDIRGADADGQPSWCMFEHNGSGWLRRTLGEYKQLGEFNSLEGMVRLARAMGAAHAALEAALKEEHE